MAFPDDTHSKCFINNKGTLGLKSHLLYRGLSYANKTRYFEKYKKSPEIYLDELKEIRAYRNIIPFQKIKI
ncbi:uncharacterized protein OCT59_024714 [Rhizophagus irregularis]|uniref:uncharacterized protein n=1 Tax=Rhizophagus irregularis TaxID=588596 RepID=UPI00332AC1D3|nr:hypothetical protein OCT59_024714 [Rhizophagus irregularis]